MALDGGTTAGFFFVDDAVLGEATDYTSVGSLIRATDDTSPGWDGTQRVAIVDTVPSGQL